MCVWVRLYRKERGDFPRFLYQTPKVPGEEGQRSGDTVESTQRREFEDFLHGRLVPDVCPRLVYVWKEDPRISVWDTEGSGRR